MRPRSLLIAGAAILAACCPSPSRATQFHALTADTTREADPAPSPDGKWLAFSSDRSGTFQIWVRPLAGGPARQLTSEPESVTVQDPQRPDTTRTFVVRAYTPTWAPDSKSILFISTRTGRYNVYTIPLEGGTARALASPLGNNRFAAYSPDGKEIAFYSNRLEPGNLFGFNVYVMDSSGETSDRLARQLTHSKGSPGHPTWSPDGRWIAYVDKFIDSTETITVGSIRTKQNLLTARYRLCKSPAQGGSEVRLARPGLSGKDVEDTWPCWSPVDSRWIAVGRRVGTKRDVWIVDATTGQGAPLTHSGTAGKPTWSHDGKAIYYTVYGARGNENIWVATDFTLPLPSAAPRKSSVHKRPKAAAGKQTPRKSTDAASK